MPSLPWGKNGANGVRREAIREAKFKFTSRQAQVESFAIDCGGRVGGIVHCGKQRHLFVDNFRANPCAECQRLPFRNGDDLAGNLRFRQDIFYDAGLTYYTLGKSERLFERFVKLLARFTMNLEDGAGRHGILCANSGQRVFEVLFAPAEAFSRLSTRWFKLAIAVSNSCNFLCCLLVGAGTIGTAFATRPSSPISGTLLKKAKNR